MGNDRIIGNYEGEEKGILLLCIASIHGNEPAGVQALELVFKMIDVEPITNPDFIFHGKIIGLKGNLPAIEKKRRFIDQELNRLWTEENVTRIKALEGHERNVEEQELIELLSEIEAQIELYQPKRVVILDLHTTAAYGGIFTLVSDKPESLRIGLEMHAPVIRKMLYGIIGTAVQYFNKSTLGVDCTSLVFESGQHNEPLSVNRAIAAIINCMRTIGCVQEGDVEYRHDDLLVEFSRELPKVANMVYRHPVKPEDDFAMRPGYRNFQDIKKGEWLANDKNGKILAQHDGLILMPLYQLQGEDGYFIIMPKTEVDKEEDLIRFYARQRASN